MDIIFHPNCWDNLKVTACKGPKLIPYMYENTTDYKYDYNQELLKYKPSNEKYLIPLCDYFAFDLCKYKYEYRNNNYKFMTCNDTHFIDNLSNKVDLSNHTLHEFLPKTYF